MSYASIKKPVMKACCRCLICCGVCEDEADEDVIYNGYLEGQL
jgi:hypothetical protein